MLIDWYTVAAQAFNFLLLVWVLKRFLYAPIRRAMHQRQERIVRDLEQAEEARLQAEESRRSLAVERAQLDAERRSILDKARQEAQQWHEQALERARADLEAQRSQWNKAIQDERNAFSRRLTARISAATFEICRKALADLADADLELRLADKMLALLPEGSAAPKEALVRTGFALGPEAQERLRSALLQRWPDLKQLRFAHNQELGFGIECLFDDNKVSWNVEHYMTGFKEQVLASVALLPDPLSENDKENGSHDAS